MLLKRAAKIEKGSGEPNRNKVGKVTRAQVREIARAEAPDLNANDVDAAMRDHRRHRPLDGPRRVEG